MQYVNNMLSQKVSKPQTPSVSRSNSVQEDYVQVSPSDDEKKEGVQEEGRETLVRHIPQGRGLMGMGSQESYPLLAFMGSQESELKQIDEELRRELLKTRSQGRHEGTLADWKHAYNQLSSTLSQSEASNTLATITTGTEINQRATNQVRLRKSRISGSIHRVQTGTPSVYLDPLGVHIVVWRDKVPATPGTAQVIHGTDTNPPTSGTLIYSRLGVAAGIADRNMVRNPITEDSYHIYKEHLIIIPVPDNASFSTTPATAIYPPTDHGFEFEIDLNELSQIYPSAGSSTSDINNLWITFWVDTFSSSYAQTLQYNYTIDTEFEDDQGDGMAAIMERLKEDNIIQKPVKYQPKSKYRSKY